MKKIVLIIALVLIQSVFVLANEKNIVDKIIDWATGPESAFSEMYCDAQIMKSKSIIYLSTDFAPQIEYRNIEIVDDSKLNELLNGDFDEYGVISIKRTENTNEYTVNLFIGNTGRSVYHIKVEGNGEISVKLLAQS